MYVRASTALFLLMPFALSMPALNSFEFTVVWKVRLIRANSADVYRDLYSPDAFVALQLGATMVIIFSARTVNEICIASVQYGTQILGRNPPAGSPQ